jgi:two-component system nitrogen regulation sensor histidine kinase GlnL
LELEDLLFSHPFPLVITDKEGRLLRANQKFELLLNRSEKYLKGKKLSELLSSPEVDAQVRRSYEQEIDILGFRLKNYFLHFSPFFSSWVKEGVLVILEPVPENPFGFDFHLFLKGLSHELRNPLSGIKGAAKLFRELKLYDEELVEVIVSEVERLERLLDQITKSYDFTRPTFKCENIHRLIKRAFNLFMPELSRKGIKSKFLFDPSLPELPLDSDKITQALVNLIKNAVEALEGSQNKELSVETGYAIRPADFIYIKIRDSGRGMGSEELERLFTPFFSTKEKGLGIGTFIVREIVKGHGGEVKVESEPGKGSRFSCLFPTSRVLAEGHGEASVYPTTRSRHSS